MDRKLRLSLLFQAAGNAKNFLSGIRGESDRTGRALTAAREKVTALQRQARNIGDFRVMQAALARNRIELEAAQVEARRLALAHAGVEKPTKAMSRGLEVARAKVRELQEQEQRRIQGLQDLRGKLSAAGIATTQLVHHEQRLKRELGEANNELAEQSRRLAQVADRQRRLTAARGRYDQAQSFAGSAQGAGMSAIGAGAAVGAPLVLSARAAMTFEDSMADVRKVVNFPTPVAFREMGRDILQLSTDIPLASEGIASIVASAGQAGFVAGKPWAQARVELLGFAEDAGKMGIAFDTTAEDAGSMMSTWRTAFRLTQDQARGLADQINYLGNNGPANALKISSVVTRIGALGEVAGLSAGEVAALGATVAGMGIEDEIAATGIKNTMLALTKGTAATKAQRKAYSALGLEAEAVARRMQVDAGGTIVDVLERIQKLKPEQQAGILTQLFGSESVGAIAPLLTNLDLLRTNLNRVGDATLYSGSMQKEFESRAATASNAVQLGWQGIKAVAVEFGTVFLPQIQAGAFWLRDLAGAVRGFAAEHPGAIRVVGALAAVLAAGLLIFGGLALAVSAILGPFALLQLTLTQTGLLFAPVIAGLTGTGAAAGGAAIGVNALLWPVLLVVAAVAALAAGAYLIYRNWGTIGPWLGKLWNGIKAVVSGAFGALKALFLNFTPLGMVVRNWGAITGFLRAFWAMTGQLIGLGIDSVLYLLMRFTPLGIIVRNWGAITGAMTGIWGRIRSAVSNGIAGLRDAITNFAPLQTFIAAFQSTFDFFAGLPGRFLRIGTDIVNGLTNGIRGGRSRVQAATRDVAGAAEQGARNRLDTHSPSRVFSAIGRDVMAGFDVGIRGGARRPISAMRTAAAAIAAAGALTAPSLAAAAPLNTIAGPRLAAAAAPAAAAPGPGAGRRGGSSMPSIGTLEIHIHQLPGQSMDDLADLVLAKIREAGGGHYGDPPGDYGEGD